MMGLKKEKVINYINSNEYDIIIGRITACDISVATLTSVSYILSILSEIGIHHAFKNNHTYHNTHQHAMQNKKMLIEFIIDNMHDINAHRVTIFSIAVMFKVTPEYVNRLKRRIVYKNHKWSDN